MNTEKVSQTQVQLAGPATPKEAHRQRGRTCKITIKHDADGKVIESTVPATFHCWGMRPTKAEKKPSFSETIGICEMTNGKIRMVKPEQIQFTDRAEA